MLPPPFENALVLTGPTGSGKSRLALELAERLGAEIISMDSMALYRGMDIGTAKPNLEERRRTPHHLVDVLDPWQSSSVAWWLGEARKAAQEIENRGKRVLFVGGTPLYLKALLFGLFEGPSADLELRQRLEEEARQGAALHERLRDVDPDTAQRVHPNDLRRIVRALEVLELTGKPMSAWQEQWTASPEAAHKAPAEPQILWIDLPREELYERINRRVEEMFAQGLVEEVRQLVGEPLEGEGSLGRDGLALASASGSPRGKTMSREARQALGYKEVLDHLGGAKTLAETIAEVKLRTRQFAKRQITWFRHLPYCQAATCELTWTLWHRKMQNVD